MVDKMDIGTKIDQGKLYSEDTLSELAKSLNCSTVNFPKGGSELAILSNPLGKIDYHFRKKGIHFIYDRQVIY